MSTPKLTHGEIASITIVILVVVVCTAIWAMGKIYHAIKDLL